MSEKLVTKEEFPKFYIYKLFFESGATYIGQHTQKKEDDGYITSSTHYQRGKDKLIKREILFYVDDKETLDEKETEYIKIDKKENPLNVNKNMGGKNCKFYFTGQKHTEESRQLMREHHYKAGSDAAKKIGKANLGRKNTEKTKQKMSKSAKKSWTEERRQSAIESGNYSHPHTEETKKFLSENRKGRVFINNGKEEKSVKNPDEYLKDGWKLGRMPFKKSKNK